MRSGEREGLVNRLGRDHEQVARFEVVEGPVDGRELPLDLEDFLDLVARSEPSPDQGVELVIVAIAVALVVVENHAVEVAAEYFALPHTSSSRRSLDAYTIELRR